MTVDANRLEVGAGVLGLPIDALVSTDDKFVYLRPRYLWPTEFEPDATLVMPFAISSINHKDAVVTFSPVAPEKLDGAGPSKDRSYVWCTAMRPDGAGDWRLEEVQGILLARDDGHVVIRRTGEFQGKAIVILDLEEDVFDVEADALGSAESSNQEG
jgi:hypothetical protein